MKNPLVSVIIPNYCHAKYLDQRIQSVLNQTYQNFEVIILDDASPDNGASKAVIEKYRENPHVSHIVYNEQNSGSTFKQWHKGFELAKGELIWIAESDDYCELSLLEILVGCFVKYNDCSIVYCSSQFVDCNGKMLAPIMNHSKEVEFLSGIKFISYKMREGNAIWNASSAIFVKSNALKIDSAYMNYRCVGDKRFWIELAERGNVCAVNEPLNFFRQHNNKVSPRGILDGTTYREEYMNYQYMVQNGYFNIIAKLYSLDAHISDIQSTNFTSSETKKELLKLWTNNCLWSIIFIRVFLQIYSIIRGRGIYRREYYFYG